MAQRPLPEALPETEVSEDPKLEVVPALDPVDEPEEVEAPTEPQTAACAFGTGLSAGPSVTPTNSAAVATSQVLPTSAPSVAPQPGPRSR